MPVRRLVHFSGNVQGVGFRATTRWVARTFEVVGYVKNLPDGRVELAAEGDADEVDKFIDKLKDKMGKHVRDARSQDVPPRGEPDFRIEH